MPPLLWDTAGHTRLASLPASAGNAVYSVAFSPDGRTLAAGNDDGVVLLWDTAGHTRFASLPVGAGNAANSVAFSPDGRTLAAGTTDGALLLWDTANDIQLASLSAGTNNAVYSVAFSPDGRTLAAGTFDGTVRLVPGEPLLRNFPALRDAICRIVTGGLPRSTWRTYAPGLPYENDCHKRDALGPSMTHREIATDRMRLPAAICHPPPSR